MPASTNDISIFLTQWEIYQQVVESNYMAHEEIASHLTHHIASHFTLGFSLLDLGCGDASLMTAVLKNSQVKSYVGIDLSNAALELARKNTRNNHIHSELLSGDLNNFTEVIQNNTFDVIVAGFSLHHLSESEKSHFFHQCNKKLKADGKLIIYDIIRQHEESRDSYLSRYCTNVENNWHGFSEQAIDVINNHITSSDYPQSLLELEVMTKKAGFNTFDILYNDNRKFHYLLSIGKY